MHPRMRYLLKGLAAPLLGLVNPGRHDGRARTAFNALRTAGAAPRVIIDVGVAHGTYTLYDAFPDAALLLVEPMAEFSGTMAAICRSRPGSQFVSVAAGAENGSLELSFPDALDGASAVVTFGETRTVPVRTLDSIVAGSGLIGPFILKIDVQGFEDQVLAGASNTLKACDAVLLECAVFSGDGGPGIGDMITLMRDLGFAPFDAYDGMRMSHGALAQIDLAFVPTTWRAKPHGWLSARKERRRAAVSRIKRRLNL